MTDSANYTTPPISRSPSYAAELDQIPVRPPRPPHVAQYTLSEPVHFIDAFPSVGDLTDYAETVAPPSPAYATQLNQSAPPSPIGTPPPSANQQFLAYLRGNATDSSSSSSSVPL